MGNKCAMKYLISPYSVITKIVLDCLHIHTRLRGFIIPSYDRLWEEFKSMEQSVEKGLIKLQRIISVVFV
jgi:hypothetical protein